MSIVPVSQSDFAPTSGRWSRRRWWASFAVLLVGAILFIQTFASPLPTTDEWCFTKSIVGMQRFDLHTEDGIHNAIRVMPKQFGSHCVVVPFLVYWPIAEWTGFDSRVFMYITLLTFVVEALLFWRFLYQRSLWAVPVALLLLGPSHYMDLLWGWQLTFAFSTVFPIAGLVVVDRMSEEQRLGKQALYLVAGLVLVLLGALSSAGGYFGFPCVVLLVFMKRLRAPVKAAWLSIALVAALVAYQRLMHDPSSTLELTHPIGIMLTALGGTIYGTPMGLFQFGADAHSVTGVVILLSIAIVVCRAQAVGVLRALALPIAITVFGLLCTLSIALARAALGNWHLEYVLMAVCGAHALAFRLRKLDRSWFSAVPFFTLSALLLCSSIGWWRGFTTYGPIYRDYTRGVEQYCRHYLTDPAAPHPFPGSWDVSANMMLFLSTHHHPVFDRPRADEDEPSSLVAAPLPASARVFLNGVEIGQVSSLVVDRLRLARLMVVLPVSDDARGVTARIGDAEVTLRRIHPSLTDIPCTNDPGLVTFGALIVPRVVPPGDHPLQLSKLH